MQKAGVSGTVPGFWVSKHSETALGWMCIRRDGTRCDYPRATSGHTSFNTSVATAPYYGRCSVTCLCRKVSSVQYDSLAHMKRDALSLPAPVRGLVPSRLSKRQSSCTRDEVAITCQVFAIDNKAVESSSTEIFELGHQALHTFRTRCPTRSYQTRPTRHPTTPL